jgi:hypothetical protein
MDEVRLDEVPRPPTLEESANALQVAQAAHCFLNAYLEKRVKAEHVRDLAETLHELQNALLGGSVDEDCFRFRAEDCDRLRLNPPAVKD